MLKTAKISGILILAAAMLALGNTVLASASFNFVEGSPLFKGMDIMPGYSVTRHIAVSNSGPENLTVSIKAVNRGWPLSNTDLSRVLEISIAKQDGAVVYGGADNKKTLYDFFSDSNKDIGVLLSGIGVGQNETYGLTVNFPDNVDGGPSSEDENTWQGKATNFDIVVGAILPQAPNTGTLGVNGVGGQFRELSPAVMGAQDNIFNILDPVIAYRTGKNTAQVIWETTAPASSAVVYSVAKDSPIAPERSLELFGYDFIAGDLYNNNGSQTHLVTLDNLDPCIAYELRAASRQAESFGNNVAVSGYQILAVDDRYCGQSSASGSSVSREGVASMVLGAEDENNALAGLDSENPAKDDLKGITVCNMDFPWWPYLVLAVFFGWRAFNAKINWQWWMMAGMIPLAVAIWIYLTPGQCHSWILFAVMVLVSLAGWFFEKQFSKR